MVGVGFDWGFPYHCEDWARRFGLSYPVLDDGDSLKIVEMFNVNYVPYNVIIDHNMVIRYSSDKWNVTQITETIEDYLSLLPSVSVAEHSDDLRRMVPRRIRLDEPYPNPFNGNIMIPFVLSGESSVRIDVFDVLGELIATILDESHHDPGRHTIRWDASPFQSGVYFIRLQTRDDVRTRKIVFIK